MARSRGLKRTLLRRDEGKRVTNTREKRQQIQVIWTRKEERLRRWYDTQGEHDGERHQSALRSLATNIKIVTFRQTLSKEQQLTDLGCVTANTHALRMPPQTSIQRR